MAVSQMGREIEIIVNGTPRRIPGEWTVAQLVGDLGLADKPVAVEVNREILSRDRWEEHRLRTGDRVEIVIFVGGGEASDPSSGGRTGNHGSL